MNRLNRPYSLLIFDWDGTLVDSIEQITVSLQAASMKICGEHISENAARGVIGLGLQEAVEQLHPEKPQSLTKKIADAYRYHYVHENKIPARLFKGVTEMLEELSDEGFVLAIATGKSRTGLEHALTEHPVRRYFTTTRCAGENKSKPHPQMIRGILDETNINPDNSLMIGDTEHDLMMAKNANIDAIAVTHGAHSADRLMIHRPLICLDKVTDLSTLLLRN